MACVRRHGQEGTHPCAHPLIYALAVAPSARRTGVARRLLAEVAANPIWSHWAHALEVNTWDAGNVLIYERLGFTVADHAREGDVDCWTMLRPIPRGG